MARPPRWQGTLDSSIAEACLAVRLFNDSAEARSFEGFVVHMHLAWLYLLHAEFVRDGVDSRYWDKHRSNRLLYVDGEAKRWELERCVAERWPDARDPVRANLGLFVRLRNRLEHRSANSDAALMLQLSGQAQAHLLNFESELTSQFGEQRSLGYELRLPIFVGTFSKEGARALRQLRKSLPRDMRNFLADYESGLDEATLSDPRYELRLRATLELAPRDPNAIAMQFTHLDELTDQQRSSIEEMGRLGRVVIRTRVQPVSGYGRLMPAAVVAAVAADLPFKFNMSHLTATYSRLKVRPATGSKNPELTNPDWCEYDEPTGSYRYTAGFVKMLIRKCSTEEGFESTTGREPARKS